MPKRQKIGDALTGGSQDVNPQYYNLLNTMVAANTYREGAFPTPIPRSKVTGERVTVMEVLKVFFNMGEADANPTAGGSIVTITAQLSTASIPAGVNTDDPRVFAFAQKVVRGAFTAAGSYGMTSTEPYVFDLTDGAGHGVLVATDNIYFGLTSFGFTAAASANVKVLYRMKDVSLAEYIGIVQSQQ